MTLKELNEAVRRDIYNQLDGVKFYEDDTSGEFYLQLVGHLNDERDNGEARGDHAMPAEIRTAARIGLKKSIERYTIEKLMGNGTKTNAKKLAIHFKLKKPLKISDGRGKKIKIPQYATIVATMFKVTESGEVRNIFRIITILPPRRNPTTRTTSDFRIEI